MLSGWTAVGAGTYTLRLAAHPHTIEVPVDDLSSHPPRMRTPDLARATVVTPRPEGGKAVRALLPRWTRG
ncbi:hypothetical protein ACFVJ8_34030 [Streptomyces yangpuensis]|uniref:hypothetical protein n=1 Tax=Streptomyces yangpuensis TaxID=1648182 RepID=UPI003644BC10